ncbi:hypothetical protein [Anaerocolumna sp. MB42-C2]|uniref:hypothetical protein n=1 Tax=Anaerocolumna sp. MB42-C2 TaxID=3070997 RepID=UPI0027DF6648|nr:hypothetical protein [Anaerocolumna sp. MB42-C2]WMJ86116.1 hypothetical protein RBU59_19015 [Anaerocolumna sp. MB42-C2]
MVHKILKVFLPAISMSFTIIIILAGIISWVVDKNRNSFISFVFEVFICLIITCVMDELIGKIDFKSYISHFITVSILIYPIILCFGITFKWFGLGAVNILFYSIIYFCIMIGIHIYFYYIEKNNVAEINRLLKEGKGNNG